MYLFIVNTFRYTTTMYTPINTRLILVFITPGVLMLLALLSVVGMIIMSVMFYKIHNRLRSIETRECVQYQGLLTTGDKKEDTASQMADGHPYEFSNKIM